jgi:hypothetical protein
LSRTPDERQPLRVFVGAGPFPDDDQFRRWIAGAEDDVRAPFAELASTAILERLLLAAQGLGRR